MTKVARPSPRELPKDVPLHTDIVTGPAKFRHMTQGTSEDYAHISEANGKEFVGLPDRLLQELHKMGEDSGGFPVDRLTHSLQSATCAWQDGRDEEYIVCALLHDIGDALAPTNHADLAATVLQPFVSEKNYWILKHHGIFQGYYFFHHLGLDRNLREQYMDSPHAKDCIEFCARYDQNCFDADFPTLPLSFFEPMLRRVLASPKNSIYLREAG